jgi:hypothetical protein
MRPVSTILLILIVGLLGACSREGSPAKGERNLPDDAQVHFVPSSGVDRQLSTNASSRLISTLRSDARHIDGRGLTAAPYGRFRVAGGEYFLFHGLISDDLYLHGRAWDAEWIESAFAFWKTNGLPESADAWQLSLESFLTAKEGTTNRWTE